MIRLRNTLRQRTGTGGNGFRGVRARDQNPGFALAACIIGASWLVTLPGCFGEQRVSQPTQAESNRTRELLPPIIAPDNSLSIHPFINRDKSDMSMYLCVGFELQNRAGYTVYSTVTSASDRMKWRFEWIDNDSFVLHNSDIGDIRWQRDDLNMWQHMQ